MRHFTLALATFAALSLSAPVRAETPADTLVIADTIDDIVSLDPAESFEFSGQDALNNVYDRLIQHPCPRNNFALEPGLAESWSVSDDGKTYTFKMKEGLKFHSGNPMTAEDAAWSLQRVVKLNKTPSFILTQFGFTPENVDQMIKATRPTEFTITTDKAYAQSFFYNILTAIVASVVDKKVAMEHEANGDFGYEWLKTNSAGSGPYMLRSWKPNDSIVLERVDGYWGGDVALKRVFVRHVPEARDAAAAARAGRRRHRPPPAAERRAGDRRQCRAEALRRAARPHLLSRRQPEARGAAPSRRCVEALQISDRLRGHGELVPEGPVRRPPEPSCRPASSARSRTTPTSSTWRRRRSCSPQAGYPDGFDVEISVRNEQTRHRHRAGHPEHAGAGRHQGRRSRAAPARRSSTPTAPARTS